MGTFVVGYVCFSLNESFFQKIDMLFMQCIIIWKLKTIIFLFESSLVLTFFVFLLEECVCDEDKEFSPLYFFY